VQARIVARVEGAHVIAPQYSFDADRVAFAFRSTTLCNSQPTQRCSREMTVRSSLFH
jgi:hypothetical protein